MFVPGGPWTRRRFGLRRALTISAACGAICAVSIPLLGHFAAGESWATSITVGLWSGGGATALILVAFGVMRAVDWIDDRIPPLGWPRRRDPQSLPALLSVLDEVEAEMRRIGYWTDDPPPLMDRYRSGELRSYLDAPTFELWLQCVFLPNARDAVRDDKLPPSSSVGVIAMRQYDYHSHVEEALPLLALLQKFDVLANRHVGHDPLG